MSKSSILTQISMASVSFVGSSLTAAIIARSRTPNGESPLKTSPYHRIILGLSISDIFQSSALITGPFTAPSYVPQAFWGVGNANTCRMNGFLMTMGSTATPMYVLMLCIYCLFSIKRTRPNQDEFPSKRLEWMMHAFILTFNLCLCVAGLITKSFNTLTSGSACGFANYPTGCRQNPDDFGECDEDIARHVFAFANVSSIGVPLACMVGIMLGMGMICWHVVSRNVLFRPTAGKDNRVPVQVPPVSSLRQIKKNPNNLPAVTKVLPTVTEVKASEEDSPKLKKNQEAHGPTPVSQQPLQPTTNAQAAGQDEVSSVDPEALMRAASREIIVQAFLFVLAFFVTYIFWWTTLFMLIFVKKTPPVFVYLLGAILYPLGGFFNILVFIRPKVNSFLRRNGTGNYSWIKGFFVVVKAGFVVPPVRRQGRNNKNGEPSDEPEYSLISTKNLGAEYNGSPHHGDSQSNQGRGEVGAARSDLFKCAVNDIHVDSGYVAKGSSTSNIQGDSFDQCTSTNNLDHVDMESQSYGDSNVESGYESRGSNNSQSDSCEPCISSNNLGYVYSGSQSYDDSANIA